MNSSEKRVKKAFLERIKESVESVGKDIEPLNVLSHSFLSFTQALATEASMEKDKKRMEKDKKS